MIVTELYQGIKLYLLVGGRGTRLASITKGMPKPLVDVHNNPFLDYVLNNLKGFDITLVCSNLNYEHFKQYKEFGIDVFNEGEPSGTAGFLMKVKSTDPVQTSANRISDRYAPLKQFLRSSNVVFCSAIDRKYVFAMFLDLGNSLSSK